MTHHPIYCPECERTTVVLSKPWPPVQCPVCNAVIPVKTATHVKVTGK